MRMARSRTAGENFRDFVMAPLSSLEAFAKLGALQNTV